MSINNITVEIGRKAKMIADMMDEAIRDFDWDEIEKTLSELIISERMKVANEIRIAVRQSLVDAAYEHKNDTSSSHAYFMAEIVASNSIEKLYPADN